jgi:hypothetical protein
MASGFEVRNYFPLDSRNQLVQLFDAVVLFAAKEPVCGAVPEVNHATQEDHVKDDDEHLPVEACQAYLHFMRSLIPNLSHGSRPLARETLTDGQKLIGCGLAI